MKLDLISRIKMLLEILVTSGNEIDNELDFFIAMHFIGMTTLVGLTLAIDN